MNSEKVLYFHPLLWQCYPYGKGPIEMAYGCTDSYGNKILIGNNSMVDRMPLNVANYNKLHFFLDDYSILHHLSVMMRNIKFGTSNIITSPKKVIFHYDNKDKDLVKIVNWFWNQLVAILGDKPKRMDVGVIDTIMNMNIGLTLLGIFDPHLAYSLPYQDSYKTKCIFRYFPPKRGVNNGYGFWGIEEAPTNITNISQLRNYEEIILYSTN